MKATNSKQHLTKEQIDNREKNEPKIASSKLSCPVHVSKEAKIEWARIVKLYSELENPIINDLDKNALEIYCEAVVTYRKAMEKIRETTEVYKGSDNQPKRNPWLIVANQSADQIKKFGEILLLDPVSRARAGLAKSQEEESDDPMQKLLNERMGIRRVR